MDSERALKQVNVSSYGIRDSVSGATWSSGRCRDGGLVSEFGVGGSSAK